MPKRQTRSRAKDTGKASALLDIYTGGQGSRGYDGWAKGMCLGGSDDGKAPSGDVFKRCRYWRRENLLARTLLWLKLTFYHSGFRVTLPGATPKKNEDFRKEHGEHVGSYAREAVGEWLLSDNLISFWRDESTVGRPLLLKPENVVYSDLLGTETLKLRMDLAGLSAEQRRALPERYRQSEVTLVDGENGEHWKVTKRGMLGDGLAWPGLYAAFKALAQCESLEVGESLYAYLYRTAYRQIKVGHEVKNGLRAGDPMHFWTPQIGASIDKALTNKLGVQEFSSNFDRSIVFPYPDPKYFDPHKFDSTINRLQWWAGAVGFLLTARGLNPHLMDMLKEEAHAEREILRPHLEHVIADAFDQTEVQVTWSDKCFKDSRLFFEMLRFAVQQGAGSLATYGESAGLDPMEERARMKEEAGAPDGEVLPRLDRSGHRDAGGTGGGVTGSGAGGGKPKGGKDAK